MFVIKFINQIEYLKNCEDSDNSEWKADTIKQLQTIINKYKPEKKKLVSQREEMIADVDRYVYMKAWSKLQISYRIKLINNYVNNNYDSPLRENILTEIIPMIKAKKLNRQKHVIYDRRNTKIESIPALKITKDGITIKH